MLTCTTCALLFYPVLTYVIVCFMYNYMSYCWINQAVHEYYSVVTDLACPFNVSIECGIPRSINIWSSSWTLYKWYAWKLNSNGNINWNIPPPHGVDRRGLNNSEFLLILLQNKVPSILTLSFPLKVLTNEKRGGLRVISFDRPPFKLLLRKFSKASVQAPSCEKQKATQRTLFLLFANNY